MTSDIDVQQVQINVKEQGLKATTVKFDKLNSEAEALNLNLKQVAARFKEIKSAQAVIQSKAGLGINSTLAAKKLATGGPLAQLSNAQTQGTLQQIKAMDTQVKATIAKAEVTAIKNLGITQKNQSFLTEFNRLKGTGASARNVGSIADRKDSIEVNKALLADAIANKESARSIQNRRTQITRTERSIKRLQQEERKAIQTKKESTRVTRKQTAAEKEANQISSIRSATANKSLQSAKRDAKVANITGDGGAALFKIQSQLIGNFLVMNTAFQALSFGKQFIIELDQAFTQLQAITATTATEMEGLKTHLIGVSEQTKFTAVEVAEAATVLGQAGFSTTQIKDSIEDITLLATAVGTDLNSAVELTTSTLAIFNLRAEETGHVADVITGAINSSKLNLEKLSLGLQFAGNAASQAGASFEETVSVLGAMANAGIRSGSTLGTGLRQVLVSFLKPTKNMRAALAGVGLTMEDLDVKSNGLINVFENLKNAGFGATEAFQGMQIRSAAAFLAISNNIDVARELETALLLSSAAAEANTVQMTSLANSSKVFASVFGSSVVKALEPAKDVMIVLIKILSEGLKVINNLGIAVPIVGTAIAGLVTTSIVKRIALLAVNLRHTATAEDIAAKKAVVLTNTTKLLGKSVAVTSLRFRAAAVSVRFFSGALSLLKANAVGLVITGAVVALSAFGLSANKAAKDLDKLKASIDGITGELEKNDARIQSVQERMAKFADRSALLEGNSEALKHEILKLQVEFGQLGLQLDDSLNPIDAATEALGRLEEKFISLNKLKLTQLISEEAILFQDTLGQGSRQTSKFLGDKVSLSGAFGDAFKTITGQGGATPTNPNVLRAEAVLKDFADKFDRLKGLDLSKLDTTGRDKTFELISQLRTSLDPEISRITDAVKATPEGSALRKELESLTEALKSQSATINEAQASLGRVSATEGRITQTSFEQTPTAKSLKSITLEIKSIGSQLISDLRGVTDLTEREDIVKAFKQELATKGTPANELLLQGITLEASEMSKVIQEWIISQMSEVNKELFTTLNKEGDQVLKAGLGQNLLSAFVISTNKVKGSTERNPIGTSGTILSSEEITKQLSQPITAVEALKQQLDKSGKKNDLRITAIKSQIASSEKGGPLEGRFGSVQIKQLNAEIERLKLDNLRDRELGLQQAQVTSTSNIAQAKGTVSSTRGKANKSRTQEDVTKAKKALQALNASEQQAIKITEELIQVQAELGGTLEATSDKVISRSDEIKTGFKNWFDSTQEFDVGEVIASQMDNASSSFAGFLTNVLNGTGSIKDAFKSMTVDILKSLQKLAAQIAAEKLLGLLISFGVGLAAGPSSETLLATPTGSSPGFSTTKLNNGGFIRRAAAGFQVPGTGASNRDSVPILARPGEFVLRNSAVDALGRDNLSALNSAGNNIRSQSLPSAVANQNSSPVVTNVYVISPDQQPPMTASDVIVTITEDLAKGGSTKKLVKSIVQGRS